MGGSIAERIPKWCSCTVKKALFMCLRYEDAGHDVSAMELLDSEKCFFWGILIPNRTCSCCLSFCSNFCFWRMMLEKNCIRHSPQYPQLLLSSKNLEPAERYRTSVSVHRLLSPVSWTPGIIPWHQATPTATNKHSCAGCPVAPQPMSLTAVMGSYLARFPAIDHRGR